MIEVKECPLKATIITVSITNGVCDQKSCRRLECEHHGKKKKDDGRI